MTPKNFTPGQLWRTRDGSKARIYAVDGGGDYPIHGAVLSASEARWTPVLWNLTGARGLDDGWCLDIPWIDPPQKRRRLLAYREENTGRIRLYPEDGMILVEYKGEDPPGLTRVPHLDGPEEQDREF